MEQDFIFGVNDTTHHFDEQDTDDLKVQQVDMALETLSLQEKIGEMLIMGFEGKYPTDTNVQKTISYLNKGMLGGTILFGYNVESPFQLKELTDTLKQANSKAFIAADQEGGKVQRLTKGKGFTGFPSHFEVASNYNTTEAADIYDKMASELSEHGINLNFAPVVDINDENSPCSVIGGLGRSFGGDVDNIIAYSSSFIDSHHKHNINTAIKHFPGHGLAQGDTHAGMVDVTTTAQDKELLPFYRLIENDKVDMVMTAHIVNQNIDPAYPITLSPIALKSLLRDKGYDGVIVTDDLHMGAILSGYGLEEAIIHAIEADNDLIVISNNKLACKGVTGCEQDYDIPEKFLKIVLQAIKDQKISADRIEKSYNRINKLKNSFY